MFIFETNVYHGNLALTKTKTPHLAMPFDSSSRRAEIQRKSRFFLRGAWRGAHGSGRGAHGSGLMAHGSGLRARGSWLMAHSSGLMVHGSWLIAQGVGRRAQDAAMLFALIDRCKYKAPSRRSEVISGAREESVSGLHGVKGVRINYCRDEGWRLYGISRPMRS